MKASTMMFRISHATNRMQPTICIKQNEALLHKLLFKNDEQLWWERANNKVESDTGKC